LGTFVYFTISINIFQLNYQNAVVYVALTQFHWSKRDY